MKKILVVALMAVMALSVSAQDYYQVTKTDLSYYSNSKKEWSSLNVVYPTDMTIRIEKSNIYINAQQPQNINTWDSSGEQVYDGYSTFMFKGYDTIGERTMRVYMTRYDNGKKTLALFFTIQGIDYCLTYYIL